MPNDILLVRWLDSCGSRGSVWNGREDQQPHDLPTHCTVGILLWETPQAICLASSWMPQPVPEVADQVAGVMTIPQRAVLSRQKLTDDVPCCVEKAPQAVYQTSPFCSICGGPAYEVPDPADPSIMLHRCVRHWPAAAPGGPVEPAR